MPPRPRLLFVPVTVALAVSLAGCTRFPALDGQVSAAARAAAYPGLLPLDQVLAGTQDGKISDATATDLEARLAYLRARAARLRAPVLDAATIARLNAAVQRHS